MSRGRMIASEIWASSSFSKLSTFAKLVFIGLITNADDEGKGIADPEVLKGKLFPRNSAAIRLTDIEKALSQIAREISVQIYTDNRDGTSIYSLTKWALWQKIPNPQPSIYPDSPTNKSMGERGRYTRSAECEKDPFLYNKYNNTKERKKETRDARAPTYEEVEQYCKEINAHFNPNTFYNYYEANGWKVGKNPMRNWKAAVRRWESNGIDNKASNAKTQDQDIVDKLNSMFTQITEDG